MIDTESAVRRLIERKKISVELKEHTEDSGPINSELIFNFIKLSQQISPITLESDNRDPGADSRSQS